MRKGQIEIDRLPEGFSQKDLGALVVGITGYKGSGKDSTAAAIQAAMDVPVQRTALADPIREQLSTILAKHLAESPFPNAFDAGGSRPTEKLIKSRLLEEMNDYSIDPDTGLPVKEKYRLLAQAWGTEFGREFYGESYWVNQTLTYIHQRAGVLGRVFVVPDVRFPNEAEAIRKVGGVVLRVERMQSVPTEIKHASESYVGRIKPDMVVPNHGTLVELQTFVKQHLAAYLESMVDVY